MPTFPRTIKPARQSKLTLVGPLRSRSQAGTIYSRALPQYGRTWEEHFFFESDDDGEAFLAQIDEWFNLGTELTVPLQGVSLLGAGGGTPLVKGASQTGSSLDTDGWPASTVVLKAGDWITLAGITQAFRVTSNVTSDGSGNATIPITPQIISGGSPSDNAAITLTDSFTVNAVIVNVVLPPYEPDEFVAMSLTFQEAP